MKTGMLAKFMKSRKSPANATEVDRAVGAIVALEQQVNDAGTGLHQARQSLERAMSDAMSNGKPSDHTGMTTGVLEAQAKLDSTLRMLAAARIEAAHVIDVGRPGYRDATSLIDGEIKDLQHQIGRRKAEAIAAFCHLQGLTTIEWPSDFNGGIIRLPVMDLAADEYAGITAAAAEQPRPEDPAETELAALRDRLLTMQTLGEQPAAMALDQLVARAQRKGQ